MRTFILLSVAACAVAPGALVRLDAADSSTCPSGGTVIVTGLDRDGDGVLTFVEETDREAVCSGTDGKDGEDGDDGEVGGDTDDGGGSGSGSLVAVTPATPADCADGGVVVLVGDDTDGDGTLTGAEITTRQPVCNGADGDDGDDGSDGGDGADGADAPLVTLAEATVGECPDGGVAVLVGDDLNGDGILSPTEVTDREPVCGASSTPGGTGGGASIVYGLVTIGSTADFARLAGVQRIEGQLRIYCDDAPLPDLLPLSTLREVTGEVRIERCAELEDFSGLDALTTVGQRVLILDLPDLLDLTGLGALTYVGGSMVLIRVPSLASLDGVGPLSLLGGLSIEEADLLTSLDGLTLPVTLDGYLSLTDNKALSDLGALRAVTNITGGVRIEGSKVLTSLAGMEGVRAFGSYLYLWDNPVLRNLDGLSGLRSISSNVFVEDNAMLRDISGLHGLTTYGSGGASWENNRCLPLSEKTAFEAATGRSIGAWISNGAAAPCP